MYEDFLRRALNKYCTAGLRRELLNDVDQLLAHICTFL